MSEKMQDKADACANMAAQYEHTASTEECYDKKLAEHTRKVAAALRTRTEYIRSRLDA